MTDENGERYLVGFTDIESKASEHTLDAWKFVLGEIDYHCKGAATDGVSAGVKLLSTIRNTMSDRAATEVKFHRLLEKYISECVPLIAATPDDQLEEGDRMVIRRLNNFFCALHSLIHYADLVDKTALEHEEQNFGGKENIPIFNPTFRQAGESAAARAIRLVCKSVSRGGDEKCGMYGHARTFFLPILKAEFDAHSLPITPYLRNRFSILFHNASAIYCLYDHLVEFFTLHQSNHLLKSALFDLKNDFIVSEIRGIGIISKTIIAPLWNCIEDKSVDLSQMNGVYGKLLQFLEDSSADPQFVLQGNSPFPEKYLRKDKYWDKIFAHDERFDGNTLSTLAIFLPALAIFTKRHFADHLPGGRYEHLQSSDVLGTDKENMISERSMAQWDNGHHQSPNKSEIALEAKLCYAANNVRQYIRNLDPASRRTLILDSRAETPAVRARFKERQSALKQAAADALQQKKVKAQEDEQKRIYELVDLTAKVNGIGGLWKSADQVDAGLAKVKQEARGGAKGKLLDALKVQLAFRKKVLKQPLTDAKLWSYSEKGRNFDIEELSSRLKLVIAECPMSAASAATTEPPENIS